MDTNIDTDLKRRQKAAEALAKLEQLRFTSLRNTFLTPAGFSRQVLAIVVNAIFFRFIMRWLPGVDFVGSLGDAVLSALVLMAVSVATGRVFRMYFMDVLRAVANGGGGGASIIMMLLPFVFLTIELWVVSVFPGALELSGFFAWALAAVALMVSAAVQGRIAKRICPASPETPIFDDNEGTKE